VRAVCDKREIMYRLDGRTVNWLLNKINEYEGINISQSNLYTLLSNQNNWLLTYALIVAKILNCPVEDVFHLE